MNKVELVEENQGLSIQVEQAPIIKYDAIEAISEQVKVMLDEMDLENIEVTEENLKEIKKIRAFIRSKLAMFEDQRKYVKEVVEKPYKEFEAKYKVHISDLLKEKDNMLKSKIDEVNEGLLENYVNEFKEYFAEKNEYDFVKFEDMDIKINISSSEKTIKKQIDDYFNSIALDLDTIETLENKDRVKAKYQMSKNLNLAISQVAQEVKIEEENKAKKAMQAEQEKVQAEQPQHAEPNLFTNMENMKPQADGLQPDAPEELKATFTVYGSLSQLRALKQFMESEGIIYEQPNTK